MRRVKQEVVIYLFLLLFLCVWMHAKALLDHPIEHFEAIGRAPFGWLHPFLYTFVVYILILIVRIFIKLVRKFVDKGAKRGI